MGYAVELYFDKRTEQSVLSLRASLAQQGISYTLGQLGERPHVSLAVFSEIDYEALVALTHDYARMVAPFTFALSAVGTFPTPENAIFLLPVPTRELLDCHRAFHLRLAGVSLIPSSYYLPGNWIPHCSVDLEIPTEQLASAFHLCKEAFRPLTGEFQQIGVVEFRPIRTLAISPLGRPRN